METQRSRKAELKINLFYPTANFHPYFRDGKMEKQRGHLTLAFAEIRSHISRVLQKRQSTVFTIVVDDASAEPFWSNMLMKHF